MRWLQLPAVTLRSWNPG